MLNINKISIVLKIEKFDDIKFKKNINSILNQTYPNLEIIILDSSKNVKLEKEIEKLKNNHNNISIIHIEKISLVANVLDSINYITGESVIFLNDDVSICRDFCRKLYVTMKNKNADISVTDWVWENENGTKCYIPYEEFRNMDFELSNNEILTKYVSEHGYNFSWDLLCNKMFSISLLKRAQYDLKTIAKIAKNSSMALNFVLFSHAKKLVNCHNNPCYIPFGQKTQKIKKINKENLEAIQELFIFFDKKLQKFKLKEDLCENLNIWKEKILSEVHLLSVQQLKTNLFQKYFGNIKYETKCVEMSEFTVDFGNEFEDYEKIIEAVTSKNTKIVSFDIFDTLISRSCLEPKDIFLALGDLFRDELSNSFFVDYKTLRSNAESYVRFNYKHNEVDIYEIYDYMVKEYGFDKILAQKLLQKEMELELEYSIVRHTGKDIYDIALLNNKKIIYASDMYLSQELIYKLLEKNGYSKENELFLSFTYKASKHLGHLYKKILEKCKVPANMIVHIGDNYFADIEQSKKYGINSFWLPNSTEQFKSKLLYPLHSNNISTISASGVEDFIGARLMCATVARKLFDFPFTHPVSNYQCSPTYVGYYALGMHMFAFIDWAKNITKNKYNCIHFVARDGFLPMKVYEIFQQYYKDLPNCNYIYLSRKFLYPLSINEKKDLFSSSSQLVIEAQYLDKILSYFPKNCVIENEINIISKKDRTKRCTNPDDFHKLIPYLDKCIDYKKLHNYNQACKKNLNFIKPNDILLDIGYSGRDESILSNLLGFPIDSIYLHTRLDYSILNFNKSKSTNYSFYHYMPSISFDPREIVIMSTDPSVIGFDQNKNKLIFEKNKNNEELVSVISSIQSNCLNFIKDMLSYHHNHTDLLHYGKDAVSLPWEIYIANSSTFDRMMFANFIFEDDIAYGKHSLLSRWDSWCTRFKTITPQKPSLMIRISKKILPIIMRIVNKLLPIGSKRRAMAKNLAIRLCPPESKRREFAKKILKDKKY